MKLRILKLCMTIISLCRNIFYENASACIQQWTSPVISDSVYLLKVSAYIVSWSLWEVLLLFQSDEYDNDAIGWIFIWILSIQIFTQYSTLIFSFYLVHVSSICISVAFTSERKHLPASMLPLVFPWSSIVLYTVSILLF